MKYELMWNDLKGHLEALAESIERSVENMKARPYAGAETDELFKAYREATVMYSQKDKLRIIRNILIVMESMEEGYR